MDENGTFVDCRRKISIASLPSQLRLSNETTEHKRRLFQNFDLRCWRLDMAHDFNYLAGDDRAIEGDQAWTKRHAQAYPLGPKGRDRHAAASTAVRIAVNPAILLEEAPMQIPRGQSIGGARIARLMSRFQQRRNLLPRRIRAPRLLQSFVIPRIAIA